MGSWTTTKSITLVERTCWCGMRHAIPKELSDSADEDETISVYCPVGHSWVSLTHTKREEDRLRQRIASLKDDVRVEQINTETERRRHAATKGQLTKTKKRVQAGMCIECNRTFQNLARHMESKHTAQKVDGANG